MLHVTFSAREFIRLREHGHVVELYLDFGCFFARTKRIKVKRRKLDSTARWQLPTQLTVFEANQYAPTVQEPLCDLAVSLQG